jgi:ethanolaminephosphotransferase
MSNVENDDSHNNDDYHYYYLTPQAVQAVRSYQYRGIDHSLWYRYVSSPLAQYLVDTVTPVSTAPNTITATGLLMMMSSYGIMWYYDPMLNQSSLSSSSSSVPSIVPSWVLFYNAFCIFAYQTLDNMDGKQARKTNSSSSLGLLFDHGCDAINSIFGSVNWIIAMELSLSVGASSTMEMTSSSLSSSSWDMMLAWIIVFGPYGLFYISTWEEYYTGCLILPIINGVNEGLMGAIGINIISAMYGTSIWHQTSVWTTYLLPTFDVLSLYPLYDVSTILRNMTPLRNMDLLLGLSTILFLQEYVIKITHVTRQYGITALLNLIPFLILLVSTAIVWLVHPMIVVLYPRSCFHLIAGLFVEMTIDLMFCHVSQQPYQPFRWTLIPLILGTTFIAFMPQIQIQHKQQPQQYREVSQHDHDDQCNNNNDWMYTLLLIYTTAILVYLIQKITLLIHEISWALNVWCFDITTPRSPQQTKALFDKKNT